MLKICSLGEFCDFHPAVIITAAERRNSATCLHCNGADEMAEHLVLQCPAHDQVRRDIWPGEKFNADPRHLWDFLKRIGTVTPYPRSNWE